MEASSLLNDFGFKTKSINTTAASNGAALLSHERYHSEKTTSTARFMALSSHSSLCTAEIAARARMIRNGSRVRSTPCLYLLQWQAETMHCFAAQDTDSMDVVHEKIAKTSRSSSCCDCWGYQAIPYLPCAFFGLTKGPLYAPIPGTPPWFADPSLSAERTNCSTFER